MARYIASTLFKVKDNAIPTTIQPYLIKYNSGDVPADVAFKQVTKFIEDRDGVSYYAGKPIPCYSDARYTEVFKNISRADDYTFLFSSPPKPPRDEDKFKQPIPRSKK